jgi:hypothetical protein
LPSATVVTAQGEKRLPKKENEKFEVIFEPDELRMAEPERK